MNQIIFYCYNNKDEHYTKNKKVSHKKGNKKIFMVQFIISSCFLTILILLYLLYLYDRNKYTSLSKEIENNFSITSLYSNNSSYSINKVDYTSGFPVVGLIEIKKLELKYPIFEYTNEELLKIAPCRFYGPMPNENGNLCIAGHNYDNNSLFSNLYKLNINDEIVIYDIYKNYKIYYVYDKFEVEPSKIDSALQNAKSEKEITLLTCNNKNGNRIIVKATQKA